jgi:hypothetical protein
MDRNVDLLLYNTLDEELVPLERAIELAYSHIVGASNEGFSHVESAQVLPLIGIALAAIAPIYRTTPGARHPAVLNSIQAEQMVARPARAERHAWKPAGFLIRARDLRQAIAELRQARRA